MRRIAEVELSINRHKMREAHKTFYNTMPNGDLIITHGAPYTPGPIGANNPFEWPVHVSSDHGEWFRQFVEDMARLKEMFKGENKSEAGQWWTPLPKDTPTGYTWVGVSERIATRKHKRHGKD